MRRHPSDDTTGFSRTPLTTACNDLEGNSGGPFDFVSLQICQGVVVKITRLDLTDGVDEPSGESYKAGASNLGGELGRSRKSTISNLGSFAQKEHLIAELREAGGDQQSGEEPQGPGPMTLGALLALASCPPWHGLGLFASIRPSSSRGKRERAVPIRMVFITRP